MWGEHALDALDRCQRELPDLRRAFEYALLTDPTTALTMATDLYALWLIRDLAADGRRWLNEAIAAVGGIDDAPASPRPGRRARRRRHSGLDDGQHRRRGALPRSGHRRPPNGWASQPPPKALVRLGSIRSFAGDMAEGRRLCRLARGRSRSIARRTSRASWSSSARSAPCSPSRVKPKKARRSASRRSREPEAPTCGSRRR